MTTNTDKPEHADFNTDGHIYDCGFDEYEGECDKDCAAWLYSLWTEEIEKCRKTKEDPNTNKVDLIDSQTGEVQDDKPYRSEAHMGFGKTLASYQKYIRETLRDPEDIDSFARMSPDALSLVLAELTAMYESLSAFLANQKLWVSDLKTSRQLKFSRQYLNYKSQKGFTNETARNSAILDCEVEDRGIDRAQHVYNVIEAFRKSTGRYHDSVRSTLSYEKSLGVMSRGVN